MKLKKLATGLKCQIIGKNVDVKNLTQNSKKIAKDMLFFCIDGTKTDGNLYIDEAIKNGAVAIVTSKKTSIPIPQILVNDVRFAMPIISANFYNNPQKKLNIVAITGTNGKTSCTYLIKNMLEFFGKQVGVIGTNGVFICGKKLSAHLTTPDAIELFEIFSQMVKKKVKYCIMEASAHAIYLHKLCGIKFKIKALTNVKSDHLDFFKTKQNYQKVKQSFFDSGSTNIVNIDDVVGKKIAQNNKKCITFGKKNANFCFFDVKLGLGKTNFKLKFRGNVFCVSSNLTGLFNVYNLALCIAVVHQLKFNLKKIISFVPKIKNLDGRLDMVDYKQNFAIIVDYAHTTDSLKNLLTTITTVSKNKNVIVIGCPGERDTTKRFDMGKLAGEFCKWVIFTADNPASENAKRIMHEMFVGASQTKTKCFLIENRQKAIKKAIKIAKNNKNTNVLVVGKGIEDYQIEGGRFKKYSDYQSIKNALK